MTTSRHRTIAIALVCGLAAAQVAARTGDAIALQPLGTFHGDEVAALDGERWLVLWRRADGSAARLAQAKLRVARVHDPVEDLEGQATGREVSVSAPEDGSEDAVMLLRGGTLRAGPVANAESDDRTGSGLPSVRLRLGKREYAIETRCVPKPAPEEMDPADTDYRCRIELREGAVRQTLVERLGIGGKDGPILADGDAMPQIVFAGDLDRDGRLDLIFNTSDHYNVGEPTLFLSGSAGRSQLLRAVARHRSVGC